jgi:Zn-dependent protease/CBS domain-containing protein
MNWSWRVARIGGTDVKLHFTFVLLIVWFVWQGFAAGGGAGALATGVTLLVLFGSVLVHEFGHIRMARRFGIRTPDVLLLPIGGVARLERIPDEPRQELLVALAGPAVTLTIALVAYGVMAALGQAPSLRPSDALPESPLALLFGINLVLLLFNLIPAFPMDGGRVLRALLASRLGPLKATRIATRVGQGLALVFGLVGLFGEPPRPLLLLIAFFVFFGAGSELAMVEARTATRGLALREVMVTNYRTIAVHARLEQAAAMLLDGDQREFPVVDNLGHAEGILTREGLIKGLAGNGPQGTVGEAMTGRLPVLVPEMPLESALALLQASGLPALPVQGSEGTVIGMLTRDNVLDLLLLKRAQGA